MLSQAWTGLGCRSHPCLSRAFRAAGRAGWHSNFAAIHTRQTMSAAAPAELNSELDELEQNVQPTWEGLLHPYERIQDRLSKTWGAVSHLKVRVAPA